jgi:hypothetical protein
VADRGTALGIASAQLRVLTLRFTTADLERLGSRHLVYGLCVTWAVGLGRYWDHPEPYLVQALGLGSLLVSCGLALLLYAVLWPLRPARWSLLHLFTFLSLTALPAAVYAIPVERFLTLPAARTANVSMLGVVALWRVAMLGRYLARWTDLSLGTLLAALLLPLALVVDALTFLNLEQAVLDLMAGEREYAARSPSDAAYEVLFLLTALSLVASPLLLAGYGFACWVRRAQRRRVA